MLTTLPSTSTIGALIPWRPALGNVLPVPISPLFQVWMEALPNGSFRSSLFHHLMGEPMQAIHSDVRHRPSPSLVGGAFNNSMVLLLNLPSPAELKNGEELEELSTTARDFRETVRGLKTASLLGLFQWEDFLSKIGGKEKWEAYHQICQTTEETVRQFRRAFHLREVMKAFDRSFRIFVRDLTQKVFNETPNTVAIAGWLSSSLKTLKPQSTCLKEGVSSLMSIPAIADHPIVSGLAAYVHEVSNRYLNVLSNSARILLAQPERGLDFLRSVLNPLSDDVGQMIRKSASSSSLLRGENGVVFEPVDSPAGLQFLGEIDLETVQTLLLNLTENGAKYADPEKQTRWIRYRVDGENGILVYRDNGIGMNPQFAQQLGGATHMREGRSAEVEGTGTGWVLIAKACQKLGWTFQIASQPGEGTAITFTMKPGDLIY